MNRFLTARQVAGHNKKRKFKKVPREKKTGVAKKYLSGAKNKKKKAAEIKKTAALYRAGKFIDVKKVSASRAAQGKRRKK